MIEDANLTELDRLIRAERDGWKKEAARAELLQLLADLAALTADWRGLRDAVFGKENYPCENRATVELEANRIRLEREAQAEQLRTARDIISRAKNDYQEDLKNDIDSYDKGQRCIDWLASTAPALSVDAVAERVHVAWMKFNRENGCASRLAIWGEELMTPWDELSERAKNLDRATIRAVLDALPIAPAPEAEQEQTP